MKWHEAYRCKICGKIYQYKDVEYCKRCGAELTQNQGVSPYMRMFDRPNCPCPPRINATENLEPVIVKRVFFGYEIRPSTMPEWVIRGEAPPRKVQKTEDET